jgi:hypothetical protein
MNYSYFLKQKHLSIQKKLKIRFWYAELAYLDIFNKLNSFNSSMQGQKENLISASDKMRLNCVFLC